MSSQQGKTYALNRDPALKIIYFLMFIYMTKIKNQSNEYT